MTSLTLLARLMRTLALTSVTALLLSACSDGSSGNPSPASDTGSGSEQVPIVTPPASGSLGEQGTNKPATPNSQLDCAP
ncbi:hypothetical protein SBO82_13170 [Alcaligenes nematophilus]|jgi:hypothetical protein|uniref:Uncharacterized protein n=1 Tax=Alcaligenes phenolicus TaxID=232846 RepID=A0ABV2BL84_9BURK|nr:MULTISPECIES: hypothetical protein [Alcaligenes]MDH4867915.1 hypothetical protein [Bacillus cereus]MDY7129226.1 hypothetical protein [Alcaligenes nematophilus]ULH06185.1 hypothetical protein MF263_16085 [Alcaligenes faecalis]